MTPLNSRFHVTIVESVISRPRSRRTPRGRGRPARAGPSAAPSNRTSPFSRKIARSATASATLSDCSTMIIVWPRALSSSTTSSSRCTTTRREPERELVDHQQLGLVDQHARRARASAAGRPTGSLAICLRRSASSGNSSKHVGDPRCRPRAAARRRSGARSTARFWSTVRLPNTPLPPGSCMIPRYLARCFGRHVGDVAGR